jgi:hypothetical protein
LGQTLLIAFKKSGFIGRGEQIMDGDSIQAGKITTAYTTTDVVAEQQKVDQGFGRTDFDGPVIFRVGPTNITSDGLQPDRTLDGIQGAGNSGGSGVVGVGAYYISDAHAGIAVLGFGGPPSPFAQVATVAGVGVLRSGFGGQSGRPRRPPSRHGAASSLRFDIGGLRGEQTRRRPGRADKMAGQVKNLHGVLL